MNTEKLRELTVDELAEKEELFNLRFSLATNQLDNTARLKQVKKEIARIKTIGREQELEAWSALQLAKEDGGS